jgi:hypothetical protein
LAGAAVLAVLLSACEEPQPRSFAEFMDDRIAREGTISFCNQQLPEESATSIECANARRAAAALALRAERARREELERESERKLEALRVEMAERERMVLETTLAAARAEREAYERRWGPPRSDDAADPAEPETETEASIDLPSTLPVSGDPLAGIPVPE